MDRDDLTEFRKKRVQAFLDQKFQGNKAEFGRALGYKDGAFVGQMLRGERPITEKTIEQVESLPGGKGWFAMHIDLDADAMKVRELAAEAIFRLLCQVSDSNLAPAIAAIQQSLDPFYVVRRGTSKSQKNQDQK